MRKIFFSTSLTTFLRWTMAENARGAQYQPCRDVTFFDFHENRLRTHVEISRKNAITFSFFVSVAKKSLILLPLTCPSRRYAQIQSIVLRSELKKPPARSKFKAHPAVSALTQMWWCWREIVNLEQISCWRLLLAVNSFYYRRKPQADSFTCRIF